MSNRQEEISHLRLDSFITAMVQAIPNASPPSDQTVAFEREKEVLETRLKAEIAIETESKK